MASYTVALSTILKQLSGNITDLDWQTTVSAGAPLLFNFPYTIFDNEYKKVFEENFCRRFYTREIGFETVGYFKMKLVDFMNTQFPYYNQLYESTQIKYDVFTNYWENRESSTKSNAITDSTSDTTENSETKNGTTNTVKTERSRNTNTNRNNENTNIYSDTPMDTINLNELQHATNVTNDTGSSTDDSTETEDTSGTSTANSTTTGKNTGNTVANTTTNTTDDYIQKVTGYNGSKSYPELIQEYRQAMINVDEMVLNAMDKFLFLHIYNLNSEDMYSLL